MNKVKQLKNAGFWSKHGSIKQGVYVVQFICQIVSGFTAYYFLSKNSGFESHILRVSVSIVVAAIPELIVRLMGYSAILSIVEWFTGRDLYSIEEGAKGISKSLNIFKNIVFWVAIGFTGFMTVSGSYSWGDDSVERSDKINETEYLEDKTNEAKQVAALNNKDKTSYQSTILSNIKKKEKQLENDKAFSDKHMKAYRKCQSSGGSKCWKGNTTKANNLSKGFSKRENDIQKLWDSYNSSIESSSQIEQEIAKAFLTAAKGDIDANKQQIKDQDSEGNKKGISLFIVGLLAQLLVIFMIFMNVMIDIGSGIVREREVPVVPENLSGKWFSILKERFRFQLYMRIADFSNKPFTYNGQIYSPEDVNEVSINSFTLSVDEFNKIKDKRVNENLNQFNVKLNELNENLNELNVKNPESLKTKEIQPVKKLVVDTAKAKQDARNAFRAMFRKGAKKETIQRNESTYNELKNGLEKIGIKIIETGKGSITFKDSNK